MMTAARGSEGWNGRSELAFVAVGFASSLGTVSI